MISLTRASLISYSIVELSSFSGIRVYYSLPPFAGLRIRIWLLSPNPNNGGTGFSFYNSLSNRPIRFFSTLILLKLLVLSVFQTEKAFLKQPKVFLRYSIYLYIYIVLLLVLHILFPFLVFFSSSLSLMKT